MIVSEVCDTREGGVKLIRTYSDSGFMIIQDETGIMYGEAIDPEDMHRTYTESDILIENTENDNTETPEIDFADDNIFETTEVK